LLAEEPAKIDSSLYILHDIGQQDGIDYLVMEFVEGETLAKRLEKGALPLEQVLKIGAQIAGALDKAHRNGIAHRDLKPGNIMLAASGAKLLDFGLAKPVARLIRTVDVVRHESDYLAITTVVQELLSLGRSRVAAGHANPQRRALPANDRTIVVRLHQRAPFSKRNQ
jgi:serine/threonine protein kinase